MSCDDNHKGHGQRIVVVGAGFAGMNVAQQLKDADASIVLVDRRNHHLFQPMLYQVATAELDASNIAQPIRRIFRKQKNVQVAMGEVTSIDLDRKRVFFDECGVEYDYLVMAAGMRQSYFGHDEYSQFAPGLKTLDDALEIRRRVLLAFEEAEWEADLDSRRAKLTFVIVGGGPTGVELAGAIMDVASNTLPDDFREIDTATARVILIQGGSEILPTMPSDLACRAQRTLERLGVEIRLNSQVTGVDADGVQVGDERIDAGNVIWAAGVQGHPFAETMGVKQDRAGRIVVDADYSVPGYPEVFVVGDAAAAIDKKTGGPVPGVAQGAIQSGRFVARIIRDELKNGPKITRPEFSYYDKGSMAMIGRGRAIAAIGSLHVGGLMGWLAWSLVHVMFLIGFGNKARVMAIWFWNYLRHTRRARLITGNPVVHIHEVRDSALEEVSVGAEAVSDQA